MELWQVKLRALITSVQHTYELQAPADLLQFQHPFDWRFRSPWTGLDTLVQNGTSLVPTRNKQRIVYLVKPTGHVMHQQFNIQQL